MIETDGLTQALRRQASPSTELTPAGRGRRGDGLPGPQRLGEDDDHPPADGPARPSAGRAAILGRDCHEDAVALKRDVGYLPDEPFLYPYLTGTEMLELVAGPARASPRPRRRRRAGAVAERFGLGRGRRRLHRDLLAGDEEAAGAGAGADPRPARVDPRRADQRPRPGAARARCERPSPSSRPGGRTIFLSTHLLDAAERLCHRVAIIQAGSCRRWGRRTSCGPDTRRPRRRWRTCSCA